MKMEDEKGKTKRVELRNLKQKEESIAHLNNASQLFKFTNKNPLFYLPNLDDDIPEPILEDDLQTNEQLRRKSTQLPAPMSHARRFYPPQETTCKLQRCLSNLWISNNTNKI